jgi:hypothetical protein
MGEHPAMPTVPTSAPSCGSSLIVHGFGGLGGLWQCMPNSPKLLAIECGPCAPPHDSFRHTKLCLRRRTRGVERCHCRRLRHRASGSSRSRGGSRPAGPSNAASRPRCRHHWIFGVRTVAERSASGVVGSVPRGVLQEAADRQHAHFVKTFTRNLVSAGCLRSAETFSRIALAVFVRLVFLIIMNVRCSYEMRR